MFDLSNILFISKQKAIVQKFYPVLFKELLQQCLVILL